MTKLLKGACVAGAILQNTDERVKTLRLSGILPTLAVLRVGDRPDDLSYERGIKKCCVSTGVQLRSVALPAGSSQECVLASVENLNHDDSVHGILVLSPLPEPIDSDTVRRAIAPEKDVDGCTASSLAAVFSSAGDGYPPCTAQAVVEILNYYGIPCSGRHAVILGRSLIVGRPAAMLLMRKNATVTICHSKSVNLQALSRSADILVVCTGRSRSVGTEYLRPGQTVIDVGIHFENGKMCGDVAFEQADGLVDAVTPVPGGVGAVTTSILLSHTVEAAEKAAKK